MGGRGTHGRPLPPTTPAAPPPSIQALTQHAVYDTYQRLAAEPGALVTLARLRAALHLPDHQIDQALRDLDQARIAHLEPEINQKVLTAHDRQAAIRIGPEDKHAIKFRQPVPDPNTTNRAANKKPNTDHTNQHPAHHTNQEGGHLR